MEVCWLKIMLRDLYRKMKEEEKIQKRKKKKVECNSVENEVKNDEEKE